MSLDLLSSTTRVETPFVIAEIGGVSFGVYNTKSKTIIGNNNSYSALSVTYPSYMKSLTVTKINGAVNTYTLVMEYQIRKGDDPNLLEKVFSKASSDRTIFLSYGDLSMPSYIYKREEAIITNITSNVDFANSCITYNLTCTSKSMLSSMSKFNFPRRKAKPSDIIKEVLYNSTYGLLEVFSGMVDKQKVLLNNLIASDDASVEIEAKINTSPVEYLQYLVKCMIPSGSITDKVLKTGIYKIYVVDDTTDTFGGSYFKVTKISSNLRKGTLDVYSIDIGYPDKNQVMKFNINDNEVFSLFYDYSGSINMPEYIQRIDNKGNLVSIYSPSYTTSNTLLKTTTEDQTWWTNMVNYPISATLEIKGLIKPAVLMSYVYINSVFYGKEHYSSGYYVVTKQVDTISSSGYRTTLSLLKVGGESYNAN